MAGHRRSVRRGRRAGRAARCLRASGRGSEASGRGARRERRAGMSPSRVDRSGADGAPISSGSVVTIGAYDGVHVGHRKVLQLVRELADARDLDSALVTFDRHPAQVVRPESAPKLLTSSEQKIELLEATRLLDII